MYFRPFYMGLIELLFKTFGSNPTVAVKPCCSGCCTLAACNLAFLDRFCWTGLFLVMSNWASGGWASSERWMFGFAPVELVCCGFFVIFCFGSRSSREVFRVVDFFSGPCFELFIIKVVSQVLLSEKNIYVSSEQLVAGQWFCCLYPVEFCCWHDQSTQHKSDVCWRLGKNGVFPFLGSKWFFATTLGKQKKWGNSKSEN